MMSMVDTAYFGPMPRGLLTYGMLTGLQANVDVLSMPWRVDRSRTNDLEQ